MAGSDWGVPWTFIAMDYPRGNNFYVQCVWETSLYLKISNSKYLDIGLQTYSAVLCFLNPLLLVQCLMTLRAQTEANRLHVSLWLY